MTWKPAWGRSLRQSPADPAIYRVVTGVGEGVVIVSGGIVEHASPHLIWALWLPFEVFRRRLFADDLILGHPHVRRRRSLEA